MRQLLLSVQLRDDARFENFYTEKNQAIIQYLQNPKEKNIYLTGKFHTGLTHLLQACCHIQQSCLYIPLRNYTDFSPEILKNSAELNLIALDDIDAISGNLLWEEAIFNLFNQIHQTKNLLIISSHSLPNYLNLTLPDLKSRLQSMLCLTIDSLTDEEKINALQQRALLRGFVLSHKVGQYLLTHTSRDMGNLFNLFEKFDIISLEQKKRLTIPLIKKVLDSL